MIKNSTSASTPEIFSIPSVANEVRNLNDKPPFTQLNLSHHPYTPSLSGVPQIIPTGASVAPIS